MHNLYLSKMVWLKITRDHCNKFNETFKKIMKIFKNKIVIKTVNKDNKIIGPNLQSLKLLILIVLSITNNIYSSSVNIDCASSSICSHS